METVPNPTLPVEKNQKAELSDRPMNLIKVTKGSKIESMKAYAKKILQEEINDNVRIYGQGLLISRAITLANQIELNYEKKLCRTINISKADSILSKSGDNILWDEAQKAFEPSIEIILSLKEQD